MDEKNERKKFLGSLAIPALLVAIMLAVKVIETAFGIDLGRWGIRPQTAQGLIGILTLPFLHGSWEHLLTNSVPVLVLGTALYYCYPTLANKVLLITYLFSGLLTWCLGAPGSVHVGASALIYGLNLFLIVSGFIRSNRQLIVISLIMVFLYGSFIWGMIPALAIPQHISWEGHLSGAIIGVALALILRKKGPQKEEHHWEEDEDNNNDNDDGGTPEEKPYWDVPMPSDNDLKVEYRFRR
ncbi:MAG: rhomboid family intramembrane serine protease [Bacteroidales bacterium]|nr:rhomboid family intramembrane serine protease [Bacteroidales bacterium]